MDKNKKIITIMTIIVAVVILGIIIWAVKTKPWGKMLSSKEVVSQGLGSDLYKNPLESGVPQVNPFEVETNPFKNAYQNPFVK